jgi:hypothetical protein
MPDMIKQLRVVQILVATPFPRNQMPMPTFEKSFPTFRIASQVAKVQVHLECLQSQVQGRHFFHKFPRSLPHVEEQETY